MLAPPNQGAEIASRSRTTAWARGFFGQAIEDLSRDEDARRRRAPRCARVPVRRRRRHARLPSAAADLVLLVAHPSAGPHDGTVEVDETHSPGMTDFVTVPANHTFIADHDEAIRQTLHFLEHGRFDHGAFGSTVGRVLSDPPNRL